MRLLKSALLATAAIVCAAPAFAQKSQDTLRVSINNPFVQLSSYNLPLDEAAVFYSEVYEKLLNYDEHTQKYVPSLAKSWKQIDDQTLEFELRDDIKWHNGKTFDANDVKVTLEYLIDPKSKITYAPRYTWVKSVEVLSPTKFRIHEVEPVATALAQLAYRFYIWNGDLLSKAEDKDDYGRVSPVGTGIFKVAQLDKNKGILVERYDGFNTSPNRKAQAKRVHGIPMPDRQTQTAQLMTGGLDLARNVSPDAAKSLAENPNLKVTYIDSNNLFYVALDSQDLSGNKALSDIRVRKAIHMAINREEIIKYIVPGGDVAEHINADCFKATIACDYSVLPPKYDPAGAKKLLAEAGYPNGFDLDYLVFAPNKPIGEAIAGDLFKVGIRTNVQPADIGLYRRLQGDGKLQAWSILFPTGSFPDAGNIFGVLFTGPAMKYYNDPVIEKAMKDGEAEADADKRKAIYKVAFNRINEMAYHLPISSIPNVYVHSKDVKITKNPYSGGENYAGDYGWN